MEIISRARWGARYDRGFGPAPLPALEVWLHHSVTIAPDLVWVDADGDGVEDDEERAMRLLEDIGEQRFGGGISYTWAVMPSGRIYEGHGVDRQGAHLANRNSTARAIVLVGDYRGRAPTAAQVAAVAWLLQHGQVSGWWRVAQLAGGHRQAPGAQTACPGDRAQAAIPNINQLAAGGPIQEDPLAGLDNEVRSTYLAVYGRRDPKTGRLALEFSDPGDQSIIGRLVEIQRNTRLVPQIIAAITDDPDVTVDQVAELIDRSVAEHTPTAEQIAGAAVATLGPLVAEAVESAVAEAGARDNAELARLIVRNLGQSITEGIPA